MQSMDAVPVVPGDKILLEVELAEHAESFIKTIIEFFDKEKSLGTLEPVKGKTLELVVDSERHVYSIYAISRDTDSFSKENVDFGRISAPITLVVIDPALDKRIKQQNQSFNAMQPTR